MRVFYDEVERLGQEKGTIRNQDGEYKVLDCMESPSSDYSREDQISLRPPLIRIEQGLPNFRKDFWPVLSNLHKDWTESQF
jgi:hypothetical protein